jgi:hypothetical protein
MIRVPLRMLITCNLHAVTLEFEANLNINGGQAVRSDAGTSPSSRTLPGNDGDKGPMHRLRLGAIAGQVVPAERRRFGGCGSGQSSAGIPQESRHFHLPDVIRHNGLKKRLRLKWQIHLRVRYNYCQGGKAANEGSVNDEPLSGYRFAAHRAFFEATGMRLGAPVVDSIMPQSGVGLRLTIR